MDLGRWFITFAGKRRLEPVSCVGDWGMPGLHRTLVGNQELHRDGVGGWIKSEYQIDDGWRGYSGWVDTVEACKMSGM